MKRVGQEWKRGRDNKDEASSPKPRWAPRRGLPFAVFFPFYNEKGGERKGWHEACCQPPDCLTKKSGHEQPSLKGIFWPHGEVEKEKKGIEVEGEEGPTTGDYYDGGRHPLVLSYPMVWGSSGMPSWAQLRRMKKRKRGKRKRREQV
jgi:hypothetical protein